MKVPFSPPDITEEEIAEVADTCLLYTSQNQVIPTGLTVQMLYIWDMQMENTSSCFPVLWAG